MESESTSLTIHWEVSIGETEPEILDFGTAAADTLFKTKPIPPLADPEDELGFGGRV